MTRRKLYTNEGTVASKSLRKVNAEEKTLRHQLKKRIALR